MPRSFLVMKPIAWSSYELTTKPAFCATYRNVSMWQLDRLATSASSGSTASARENGSRTDSGDDEAGTVTPPSNDH